MTHHVIIGGGPAATNAIETIRQFDNGQSRITLICDEPAHSRMALPYWLAGQISREQTHTGDTAHFQKLGVDARIGARVQSIDASTKSLKMTDSSDVEFDDLLIATGSRPIGLPIEGTDLPGVQPMWTLDHAASALQRVEGLAKPRVALIGAGFIGFIVLNAMYKRGWQLAVVEREPHVLPRMLSADAAEYVETWLHDKRISLHCGTSLGAIRQAADGSKELELSDGSQLSVDLAIIATGVAPNLELAAAAGIQTDVGILVNGRLQTNIPYIYSAGDVAQGPALFNDQPQVHAIQPTAVDHGRVAGANMAGQNVTYPGSLSMNVLDVCGLQCVSYGNWDDVSAESMLISSPATRVYRNLLWTGDQISGAVFVGQANDVGMLTDVGMVKGLMQTQTPLGPWKSFLAANPFDIRRAFVASGVADKLAKTTLVGRPAITRGFQFGGAKIDNKPSPHHAAFVNTKS